MTSIETVLVSSLIPIIGSLIMILVNRKNAKIQTEGLIADQYYKLTERLKQERDDLLKRIERNDGLLAGFEQSEKNNKIEIRTLAADNEECKYLHEVAELEMKQIKLVTDLSKWKREMVYVLDDDDDVLEDFKHKFARLSVLDYQGFHDVERFLEKARIHKPQIVVLDYLLNRDRTAQYVIDNLGYQPEVFIMSGEKAFEKKFQGQNMKFFVKDDNYILKITKSIIQYLLNKKEEPE